MKKVSIIIPCYNEEAVLPALLERIKTTVSQWSYDWEIIAVDDGSNDKTWELLNEQNQRDPRWKAISFSRNFGHQIAVSSGIHHATGDAVAVIDADLQDPPEIIQEFLKKWEEGYQVVYAVRQKRKESAWKKMSYWFFYRLMYYLVDFELPLDSGDFCVMDRKVVNVLKQMPERNRFVRGLRAWSGFKQIGVPYERSGRFAGVEKYTLSKLIKLAANGIFAFSSAPLKMASHLGVWISLLAFLGLVFTFLQRIFEDFFQQFNFAPVPGFATIVMSVLFIGGVQLFFLGMLGEYIGRIYDEVKQRPTWIIQNSAGLKTD